MKISTIINTHGEINLTLDTLESVLGYMTDKVVLIIDGAAWDLYKDLEVKACKLNGFYHNHYKSPYRNVILGLYAASQKWSDSDWYCYMEYDCLVGSAYFRKDLETAENRNIWCIGNDYRKEQKSDLTFAEKILEIKFDEVVYLLGACLFLHKNMIKKALECDFFEKFLSCTNCLPKGVFPRYKEHDVLEHLLPSLAKYWGGNVSQFAKWSNEVNRWVSGNYRKYPMRYQPDLYDIEDEFMWASIMHPIKDIDSPIREFHRKKRRREC